MIVKISDIKKRINEILKENYPQIHRYGVDVTQGLIRPCFFTQLTVHTSRESKNSNDNTATVYITYLQDAPDETDALTKYDVLKEAFGMKLHVKERYLNIVDIDFSWIGRDSNILQMEIEISYKDCSSNRKMYKKMEKITFKERMDE